jgi:hypothetical protein
MPSTLLGHKKLIFNFENAARYERYNMYDYFADFSICAN